MKKSISTIFLILSIIFCVCLILANILESKIVNICGITVTAGLMLFPITYIINDCIVEVWG
ncbi:MAG: VUT family protein, partial [Bacteroidales bacterium]